MDRLLRLGHPLLQLRQPLMGPVHEFLGTALELTKPVLQSRYGFAERHINGQHRLIQVIHGSADVSLEAVVHCLDMSPHSTHAIAHRLHIRLQLHDALIVGLTRRDHRCNPLLKLLLGIQKSLQSLLIGS